MAWALASGIAANNAENKERKYQQEQARIDLELLQIKSDAAHGLITWEEAQTRTDQWATNNHSRLQNQAALAAELDQLAPLPADPPRPSNPADSPLPAGTPQAARFQTLEQQEAQAMDKIPNKATPQERQHLIDVWAHSPEGAALLQEKQALLATEAERRAALPPPAPPPPPPGASAAKIARAHIESRRHALLLEIYARHPNATLEERQILIGKEESKFAALDAESAPINLQLIREDVDSDAAALSAILADPASGPAPAPGKK